MVNMTDKVTRFAADLVDSATIEGARQSRSSKQQLDHWTRVGRAVSEHHSAARRRIEAALNGAVPAKDLTQEERVVLNAEINANIEETLHTQHYGKLLAARGITTVALDEDGNLVRYHPDGTTVVLEPSA